MQTDTADGRPTPPVPPGALSATLFDIQHEARYLRQALIAEYERDHGCRVAVLIDAIMPHSVTLLAELLRDVPREAELHLVLCSLGGDGEVAVRLVRMAQAACARLVVVVPEMAKSAATILALGADEIVMGPTSDLGPIDPQIYLGERGHVSAKDLLETFGRTLALYAENPNASPLIDAVIGGIDAITLESARSALDRIEDIARQAIGANPRRTPDDVEALLAAVRGALVDEPDSHSAVVGAGEAAQLGLPVRELRHDDPHWRAVWALWTRYFALGPVELLQAYESARASQVQLQAPASA